MSRFVVVNDGDYNIKVQPGGSITLDTSPLGSGSNDLQGQVIITGDLVVHGNTTTIQSEILKIKDNIIVVNEQISGAGIILGEGGLQVDRGDPTLAPAAQIFFKEGISWYDSQSNSNKSGAFIFKMETGSLSGIVTNSITTGDKNRNLVLLSPGPADGTATVSVHGVQNYAARINAKSTFARKDDIPNVEWVQDSIANFFLTVPPTFIRNGDTSLDISDFSITGQPSKLELTVDGFLVSQWTGSHALIYDVKIGGNTIETTYSGTDLVLRAQGTGSVSVEDTLKIAHTGIEPVSSPNSIKLYSKDQSSGGTGLYFVNSSNTKDELMSRRKAITYSIIF
jgi:hypothetical protein